MLTFVLLKGSEDGGDTPEGDLDPKIEIELAVDAEVGDEADIALEAPLLLPFTAPVTGEVDVALRPGVRA